MVVNFAELAQSATIRPRRCVVPGAADEHALEAVFHGQRLGYVTPILVGDPTDIEKAVVKSGFADAQHIVLPSRDPARRAVELVRAGEADFVLKGRLTTKELLGPILDKQKGLNDNGFLTHFGLMQLGGYHKLLAMSDSAVIPHPTLEQKRSIIRVCTEALRGLGIGKPVVAALCATETVSPKMPETEDARQLAREDESVIGPISYDLATSREAARIKGFEDPRAGDVDMLLVPQMVTGNVMSKIWNSDPANILAGCLLGARVPVALTSRSAGLPEKLHSLLLCSLLSSTSETKAMQHVS